MDEYTINQPIGSTMPNIQLVNPVTENMPPVLDEIPKCRDCNQSMFSIGRPCLNCGEKLWQCPECKEVKLAYVRLTTPNKEK